MSKKNQCYLICPPLFPKEHSYEMENFRGFNCTHCSGNGWIPTLGPRNDNEHMTCPVCKGSGKLKAVVTTKWMPDTKEE